MAETVPTAVTCQQYIGKRGLLTINHRGSKYRAPIVILDAKMAYGNLRFKVKQRYQGVDAVNWVNASRVRVLDKHKQDGKP